MSLTCRHAVVFAAVTVVIGACSYRAGDTCDGDVCVNSAPTAVISGVGDDGALRVGSVGEVLISARQSSDPDGDVLSYAWTAGAPCDAAVVSDLVSEELRLDDLPVGVTCEVGLVVSDGRGLTASATASLVVRNVGGYVTIDAAQCVATFDPESDAPQGTPTTPFCSLTQGLIAAKTFHLAEVSLETGEHGLLGSVTIDFPVRVSGGYTRTTTDWPRSGEATSTVELDQPLFPNSDAEIVVSGGGVFEMRSLVVRRNGGCIGDCALVRVNRASLDLSSVTLGRSTVLTRADANDAPGRAYASIAFDAGEEATHQLKGEGVTIFGSANAASSHGILLNGPAEVSIADLTVYERAPISVGVRTSGAGAVSIAGSTFDIRPPNDDGSQGYAIVDGLRDGVSPGGCPTSGTPCGGSRSLTVDDSVIVVSGASETLGVAALGTGQLVVSGTSVTVDGQQAWGVLTSAVGAATVDQCAIDATTRHLYAGSLAFGVGISDNLEETNSTVGGSDQLTVRGSQIDVHVSGDQVDEAAAVNLVYSRNVTLEGNKLRVIGTSHTASVLQSVAGVRLLTCQNVTIVDGSVAISGLRAEQGVAGIADGEVIVEGVPARAGSENVTVSGVEVSTAVQADVAATAACIVMVDTRSARILGGRTSTQMTCAASGPGTTYGIFTSAADDIEIEGVQLVVQGAQGISGINDGTLVGIHDGGIAASELEQATSNLVIHGNRIRVDQANRKGIGVRLRGRAEVAPLVDDNVITVASSFKNIGVLLQSVQATVALNTIRLAGCGSGCAGPYAVGVYVMHSELLANNVLGNAISVFSSLDAEDRPAIVRHSSVPGQVSPSIGTVAGNISGSESGGGVGTFLSAIGDASTNVIHPGGMTQYLVDDVPGTGNMSAAPSYCPDGIHGLPTGLQRGVAQVIGQTFGPDIDGEAREVVDLEAGADRIAATCP